MTPEVKLANTAAWLDLLYGRCDESHGQIVIVSSSRNKLAGLHPVGDGNRLVVAAREMQNHPGCYIKVNLMDTAAMKRRFTETGKPVIGKRDEVKTIVSFHLDVDCGKDGKYVSRSHALWALDAMPKPPSLIVNSKQEEGGFHAYWILDAPHRIADDADRKRCQKISSDWNKRLKALCAGKLDSTANLDRVLRCVGVPRLDGSLVTPHRYWPDRLYEPDDLVI